MLRRIVFVIMLISLIGCSSQRANPESIALTHPKQLELNEQYGNEEKSPLTKDDLKKFVSLKFFPLNEELRVKALFSLTPDEIPFEMQTSTERLPVYRKYAQLKFMVNDVQEELAAYQNQAFIDHPEYGNSLFIPYLDETSGIESYGGGRYIDIEIPKEGTDSIVLDFNGSYNPYCAYNYKYSCPKPPLENVLDTKIEAGVRTGIIKR